METTMDSADSAKPKLMSNRTLPAALGSYLDVQDIRDEICFAIVGDLTLSGRYGESALLFLPDRVIAYDSAARSEPVLFPCAALRDAKVRRMYGNALFEAQGPEGKITLLRFTYAAAEIAEAAALFLRAVQAQGYDPALLEPVRASYDRQRSFCSRCGRKLRKPDAPCLNCEGKSKVLWKFVKYVKPQVPVLLVCVLASVVTTTMDLIPTEVTARMIDTVIPQGIVKQTVTPLLQMVLFLLGIKVFQWLVGAFRTFYLRMAGDKIIVDLKQDIYAKAQYLPMGFYDKTSTGSVINRINGDTEKLKNFLMRVSQEALVQAFLMVGIIIAMFLKDWKLSIFSLAPVPLVVISQRIFGKKIAPRYRRIWRRGSAIYSLLADTIPGVRVIKAFTNEKNSIGKFGRYLQDWLKEDRTVAKISTVFNHVSGFAVACGTIVIWAVGGSEIIRGGTNAAGGALTVGNLVAFITYANMFYGPVNFFASFNDTYQDTLASTEKILDILDAEPEHDFGEGNKIERLEGRIEFRNVNFSFDRSKKVLSNVNLVIEPGDTVGIVGTTGSGKSTLINLLMRYYDDYDGEIFIDGQNLKEVDMNDFRRQIGYVQQEPLMFKDSIFRNIAYGAGSVSPEAVINAAEVANAHGFIARLPDAYDTMLGERGVGLSGGEKQRISIARAVLKNPGILIFDEATAAVDSETEHLIQQAIERLIRGRTTLMIAHRLSTLRKANKIIVVDKGEIIEFGSPQELLAQKGKYYKLVQIQSMTEQAESQRAEENF
ncbi:MAG: ABC transporter ATP-binding protein/permease [Oscillospiraceae bacterium]|jgi:ATP-binding cassette subfamily B protein|nr:ABC transporter ATP-binding protein/permease [Oscillospiraceae bacterium]